jgi:hypothetical protein
MRGKMITNRHFCASDRNKHASINMFRHPELKQRPFRGAVLRSPDRLGPAWRGQQQRINMAEVENTSDTGGKLIAASKVNGTSVYNTAGEKLGSVYDVMIDKAPAKANTPS